MEIRYITSDFAVSPQVDADDMKAIATEGFVAVINNRPDAEVPVELRSESMRAAAEAAGLSYVENPVINGAMTMDMVQRQHEATDAYEGPVLAWCRTGTRSSIVWALGRAGHLPTNEIMQSLARAGYELPALAPQIDMLANEATSAGNSSD